MPRIRVGQASSFYFTMEGQEVLIVVHNQTSDNVEMSSIEQGTFDGLNRREFHIELRSTNC